MKEIELLHNRKIDMSALESYGFKKRDDYFIYETSLTDEFILEIKVDLNGQLYTSVFDQEEEYFLHRANKSRGAYASMIKEKFNERMDDFLKCCSKKDVIHSDLGKQILKTYALYCEDIFENAYVLRRKDNGKWFGLMMPIKKKNLGLEGQEVVEVINLKVPKEKMGDIVDYQNVFPGYHMNKKHWCSVLLDSKITFETITLLIEDSYTLVA